MLIKWGMISLFCWTFLTSCGAYRTRVVVGGVAGSAVGAGVGYAFVHHGQGKEYQTRNTIITSLVFGVVTSSLIAFYFQSLKEKELELSSQLSRYKFSADSESADLSRGSELRPGNELQFIEGETGRPLTISLDPSTRWVLPRFVKRFLPSQQGHEEAVSSHFRWEIIKPGFFVTSERSPEFFQQSSTIKNGEDERRIEE